MHALALAVVLLLASGAAPSPPLPAGEWVSPALPLVVVAPYRQPAHAYGPGHRGVDLRTSGPVTSPAAGVIAFVGSVAGRGVLTIDHGGGFVSTLEPVESPLAPGTTVARGQIVATATTGAHAPPGAVHFGVRLDGEYINPLLLIGEVPRAILLPCCADH
jgi:murein DD-endopeptidase MepM/ murein hydrolase activator NlpD